MNFTNDDKIGFKNFADCYDSWEKKAVNDTEIDILKFFATDHETFLSKSKDQEIRKIKDK